MTSKSTHNHLRKFVPLEKIKQVEKLFKIVLKWSSSQKQLVLDLVFTQRAKELRQKTKGHSYQEHSANIWSINYLGILPATYSKITDVTWLLCVQSEPLWLDSYWSFRERLDWRKALFHLNNAQNILTVPVGCIQQKSWFTRY